MRGGQRGEPGHGEDGLGGGGGGVGVGGHGMSESAGRGKERREKEGEQGAEGGRDREMGVHANFIILLINFSSSNPPAGT